MKTFKKIALPAGVGTVLATVSGMVAAEVPADVTTALTDLKSDTTLVASLAFSAFLVVVLFHYMRSAAK